MQVAALSHKTLECTADDPVAGDSGMVRRRARVKFLRSLTVLVRRAPEQIDAIGEGEMHVEQRRMPMHVETIRGLEECVLGEVKTSQGRASHVAARHADHALKGQNCGPTCHVGERDDVLRHTATLLALTSNMKLEMTRYIGLFDVKHHHVQRRSQTKTTVNRYIGCLDVAVTTSLGQRV